MRRGAGAAAVVGIVPGGDVASGTGPCSPGRRVVADGQGAGRRCALGVRRGRHRRRGRGGRGDPAPASPDGPAPAGATGVPGMPAARAEGRRASARPDRPGGDRRDLRRRPVTAGDRRRRAERWAGGTRCAGGRIRSPGTARERPVPYDRHAWARGTAVPLWRGFRDGRDGRTALSGPQSGATPVPRGDHQGEGPSGSARPRGAYTAHGGASAPLRVALGPLTFPGAASVPFRRCDLHHTTCRWNRPHRPHADAPRHICYVSDLRESDVLHPVAGSITLVTDR